MARHLASNILRLFIVATSGTTGFRLEQNIRRNVSEDNVPALHREIFYLSEQPTEALKENLGSLEELRFQTGDPVEIPWPFIGALGTVGIEKI